jgi:hypothetical protein
MGLMLAAVLIGCVAGWIICRLRLADASNAKRDLPQTGPVTRKEQ